MNKNVLNYIAVVILIIVATYLGGSFYSGSFDIAQWSDNTRQTGPAIIVIASLFFTPLLED